jgi:hypothetical protein
LHPADIEEAAANALLTESDHGDDEIGLDAHPTNRLGSNIASNEHMSSVIGVGMAEATHEESQLIMDKKF